MILRKCAEQADRTNEEEQFVIRNDFFMGRILEVDGGMRI